MNTVPLHAEGLFTVSRIAGTTYRITEAAKLGSLEGSSDTWWFCRNPSGGSRFAVLLEGLNLSRTVQYDFWRDGLGGSRVEFKGTDGSVAHVYL